MNKLLSVLGIFVFVMFMSLVVAEENETNSTTIDGNVTTNVTLNESNTNNGKLINETCQALNHRIEGRLRQFEDGRDGHLRSFVNLRYRIGNISAKLDERGFNVSQAIADLAILDEKILKFNDDYALFIQKLNETREFTCGHSNGSFKAALNAAKAQLRIVRADADDIKQFVKEIIRTDFKNLRMERREQRLEDRRDRIENRTERLENRTEMLENRIERLRNITQRLEDRRRGINASESESENDSEDD